MFAIRKKKRQIFKTNKDILKRKNWSSPMFAGMYQSPRSHFKIVEYINLHAYTSYAVIRHSTTGLGSGARFREVGGELIAAWPCRSACAHTPADNCDRACCTSCHGQRAQTREWCGMPWCYNAGTSRVTGIVGSIIIIRDHSLSLTKTPWCGTGLNIVYTLHVSIYVTCYMLVYMLYVYYI